MSQQNQADDDPWKDPVTRYCDEAGIGRTWPR